MIKRLARCVREYKWPALLSPLCMIGEVAMEVMIPLVMADLYDYGVVMQDMGVVVTKSIQLVLFAIASLSFGVASATFAAKAGTGFELDAIAACYVGGASVSGGAGTIGGALIGCFVIAILNNGMSMMGVSADWQQTVKGLVILAAVFMITRKKMSIYED